MEAVGHVRDKAGSSFKRRKQLDGHAIQLDYLNRSLLASSSMIICEWYSTSVFLFMLPEIRARLLPPELAVSSAELAGQGAFGAHFLLAPAGALLSGFVSDSGRRKRSLNISVWLTAIAQSSIAFIPPYSSWGSYSVVLLFAARALSGIATGGQVCTSTVPPCLTCLILIRPRANTC